MTPCGMWITYVKSVSEAFVVSIVGHAFNLSNRIQNFSDYNRLPNKIKSTMNKINKPGSSKAKIRKLEKPTFILSTKIEVLQSPVKSEADKKDYRVIRLENGLTAVLISDEASLNETGSELSDSESESEDESSSEFSDSDSEGVPAKEIDDSGDNIENDDRRRQLTANEKTNKLAAAALSISVGSYSDPPHVQGLAHLLEHMLFMGSKAYPKENEFDSFIKKKGGQDNAQTDCEDTTFYLEIRERYLDGALSRFANFFISPLMNKDAITREREIVDSEFQMAKPDDDSRWDQILSSTAKKGYPAQIFTWGNIVSLTKVSDAELYKELHAFRNRHYSGHRMSLAVRSRLSLDKLEAMVIDHFKNIPSNNLPPLDFTNYKASYDTPEFKRMYYVEPLRDTCSVTLTWSLPCKLHLYKCKPGQYVSWILGHEGHGSLLSYLKKKIWALAIETGNSESGSELNTMFYLFSVKIRLTREGMKNLDGVLDALFAYLALLKKQGPSEPIFLELQRIENIQFRFRQEESSMDQVEDVAMSMAYYEPQDYLTGSDLYFQYNPEEIISIIKGLNPETTNIKISDSIIDSSFYTEQEPWFGTKYSTKEIKEADISRWSKIKPYHEFYYPKENVFLTNDFSLLKVDDTVPPYPTKIFSSGVCELWHRLDPIFKLPRAHMHYYFISPVVLLSPKHSTCLDLYVSLLNYLLVEELYPAKSADLYYNIYSSTKGIIVKLSGFNEKLPLLFSAITKTMKKINDNLELNKDIFAALRLEQLKMCHNYILKPNKLLKDLQQSTLVDVNWAIIDKYPVISKITMEDIHSFSREFFSSTYVQNIVQGNMSAETAETALKEGLANVNINYLNQEALPKMRVVQVPQGEQCCCLSSLNKNDNNSIVNNYYQIGSSNIKDSCFLDLFLMVMDEPLFNILRTQKQLGYDVYAQFRDTWGILGFSIAVHSQADKFTTAYLDDQIEEFLTEFFIILSKMKKKEFNEIKESLIKLKQCADMNLLDEVSRNWTEITTGDYIFNRIKLEVDFLETITLPDLIIWAKNLTRGSDDCRKISFQVMGHKTNGVVPEEAANAALNDKLEQSGHKNGVESKDAEITACELNLLNENDKTDPPNNYYITNLEEYKKNLFLYPIKRMEF